MDYFLAFLPILGSHVVIPPISYLSGFEQPPEMIQVLFYRLYEIVPPQFLNIRYVLSLSLVNPKIADFSSVHIPMQYVTYMFVHQSYDHMIGNLINAAFSAPDIINDIGPLGLYLAYLIGGVVSVIPSNAYQKAGEIYSALGADVAARVQSTLFLPDFVAKPMTRFAESAGKVVSQYVGNRYVGSSGAVCALMGYRLVLYFRRFVSSILNLRDGKYLNPKFRHESRWDYIKRKVNQYCMNISVSDVLSSSFFLWQTSQFLFSEYQLIFPHNTISREANILENLAKVFQVSGVNHAGHIQGAACGIGFGLFCWLFRSKLFR